MLPLLLLMLVCAHQIDGRQIAALWNAPVAAAISLAGRDYQRNHPELQQHSHVRVNPINNCQFGSCETNVMYDPNTQTYYQGKNQGK